MTFEEMERLARLEKLALLAAGLSHDFNNVAQCLLSELSTMELRLRELRRQMVARPGLSPEAPDRLFAACEKSLAVLDEGLQAAVMNGREVQRLYRGEERIANPAGADLRRAAERVLRLVGSRVRPVTELRDGEAVRVAIGEDPLVRVLLNLLMNAFDALPTGTEGGRVRLQIASTATTAICDVSDNGPGVTPEMMPRLFQPFATTKQDGHGTGLGLAVSRELVRAAGGELSLLETGAAGTIFRLTLPLAKALDPTGEAAPPGSNHYAATLVPRTTEEAVAEARLRRRRRENDSPAWLPRSLTARTRSSSGEE
jgi:signal transduction histidine kinase